MKEITASEFETEVIDGSSDLPVLVDFSAEAWCAPCRALVPVLTKVAEELKDTLRIVKLNVDDCHELAVEYGIRSVPTLILFKNGLEVKQHTGSANRETLLKLVG